LVTIEREELRHQLIQMSPFFIDEAALKLCESTDEETLKRMQKRIYNFVKYYHSDFWVSRAVKEGKRGRPRKIWTFKGEIA
jgi:hypothetical protein